ncbi:GGDEF domain-containing protein, partial [Gammaproteobacteria bacterium]|nr:GGDEF domain-containing protein [Gammaproteobacteria bacterium]
MKKSRQKKVVQKDMNCPIDATSCEWFDEITRLRARVDELSQLVATDPLTGLFNLRHFKQAMQAEMDRSKRSSLPTSLVMAEVDHFET